MGDESYVGLFPDGTGKKARTIEVKTYQPDGTVTTVEAQVMMLMDARGQLLEPMDRAEDRFWRQQVLDKLDTMIQLLQQIVG